MRPRRSTPSRAWLGRARAGRSPSIPTSRHITQNIYLREVVKAEDGTYDNKEIQTFAKHAGSWACGRQVVAEAKRPHDRAFLRGNPRRLSGMIHE